MKLILLLTLGSLLNLLDSTQSSGNRQVIPWPYSRSSGKSIRNNDEISEQIINIKPTATPEKSLSKNNFVIVTDPKTGQKFRRPKPPSDSNSFVDMDNDGASSIERNMIYRGPPSMQSRVGENAPRLPQGSFNRLNGHNKPVQETQPDDYFEYDPYEYLPQAGLPPLIQEHLVTSHVRPIWSNQNRNSNPRRKQVPNNQTSIVNIFIMTQSEKSNDGKPSVHIDVSSTDGQRKPVSMEDKFLKGPIKIPISPSKNTQGSMGVPGSPVMPTGMPSTSGIGLIDPKK